MSSSTDPTTTDPTPADPSAPAPAAAVDTPATGLDQTDGGAPVALFPVRLETRFSDDATALAIRVFPEQVHVDSHEPDLTEAEIAAGTRYWLTRWAATPGPADDDATGDGTPAGGDGPTAADAWSDLVAVVDPPRARWIVGALTPTNLDQAGVDGVEPELPTLVPRDDPWTRAPMARLLPSRWVAVGYREGEERFRVWGEPVRDGLLLGLPPDLDGDPDDEIPLSAPLAELFGEDDLRWLVDYDTALAAGMAVTVTDDDLATGSLIDGVDQLVVLGVDVDRSPVEGAAEIAAQLDRHAVTEGLVLLGAGTPTSNSESDPAGPGTDPRLDPAAYDPAVLPTHPAGPELERALGLPGAGTSALALALAPGNHGLDNQVDTDLWRVLWPQTFGFLATRIYSDRLNPLGWVDAALFDQAEQHALDHVHPAGPFPTIRLGDQIHGVLPVLPAGTVAGDGFPAKLSRFLDDVRHRLWTTLDADPVPELGDSDDPEADLVGLLRRTAHSQLLRYRRVVMTAEQLLATDPNPDLAAYHAYLFVDPWALFGHSDPQITPLLATLRESAPVPIPLVTYDALSEEEPLGATSHLANVGGNLTGSGEDPTEPKTVLDLQVSLWALGTIFMLIFPYLDVPEEEWPPEIREWFLEASATLLRLSDVPTAELQRRTMGVLDTVTHRLDAWITSVATAQLDSLRDDSPGTHIGGFGYVEHLRPQIRPSSDGWIHAPSVTHASTAALLRNGHLAREEDDGAYAIDLDSERAARGLELLDGVASEQPVGVLLGYRFERALRDRSVSLARYVLEFRQASPLPADLGVDLPVDLGQGGATEAVAAREVVDGLALLTRWKDDRDALFDEVGVADGHRADVDAVLAALDDTLDASADVLVAESVHQMVAGNPERAAAALDALDRQSSIPAPQVTRTPRTGVHLQHRLAVLSGSEVPATGWEGIDDLCRRVEPRLDAWVGLLLGPPDRYRLAAQAVDAEGRVVETITIGLDDLGISALSTAMAATSPGPGGQGTELETRLAVRFGSLVTAPGAVQLILLTDPPEGADPGSLGLQDLLQLAGQVIDLAGAARPATGLDLSPESGDEASGVDADELAARAALATGAVARALEAMAALEGSDADELPAAVAALDALGRLGLPAGATGPADERSALDALALALLALEEGFDRETATADEAVAHDTALIRLVLGETFPVAPTFAAATSGLAASAADPDLLDGDPLAPASWLTRHRPVRPPVARFVEALETAEALITDGAGLDQVVVAQTPHHPGDRWVGLPWVDPDTPPTATTGIVAHLTPGTGWDQPMAGLIIDQWSDLVPGTGETTGLSFQYDAPETRAPQSILLAVPPDPDAVSWTVDALVGSVREAMDLARIRAFDIDDLDLPRRLLSADLLLGNIDLAQLIDDTYGSSDPADPSDPSDPSEDPA